MNARKLIRTLGGHGNLRAQIRKYLSQRRSDSAESDHQTARFRQCAPARQFERHRCFRREIGVFLQKPPIRPQIYISQIASARLRKLRPAQQQRSAGWNCAHHFIAPIHRPTRQDAIVIRKLRDILIRALLQKALRIAPALRQHPRQMGKAHIAPDHRIFHEHHPPFRATILCGKAINVHRTGRRTVNRLPFESDSTLTLPPSARAPSRTMESP